MAGSDITFTAVQSTLLAIISNSCVYNKLQRKIDQAVIDESVSSSIQSFEIKNVSYFQACVLKGLRIHSFVDQLRERMISSDDDTMLDFRVLDGTFIEFNSRATQFDQVYDEDSEIYRPERWLIEDQERVRAMRQTHELIFGYDASKCLGVRIATMEVNKTIFEVSNNDSFLRFPEADLWTVIVVEIFRYYHIRSRTPVKEHFLWSIRSK